MNSNTVLLALALFAPASAFQSFTMPKAKKAARAPAVPANELPLTERLGGVGITAPFDEGFDPLGLAKRADVGEMNKVCFFHHLVLITAVFCLRAWLD